MTLVNKSTASKPQVAGAVFRAPLGTTLPTDAISPLDPAFLSLGHISEDGLTNSQTIETAKTKAWGGATVYESITDFTDEYKFTMIDGLDINVLKTFYGDENVKGTLEEGITVLCNDDDLGYFSWVFEMILKDGYVKRIVVPEAKVVSKEEVKYSSDVISYGVNVSALKNDKLNASHAEYIGKGK